MASWCGRISGWANPWDGPDPDDDAMFLRNVQDYVLRIRNHPSIGLYVGRNEGFPPKPIDDGNPRHARRSPSGHALHSQLGRRRGQRPRSYQVQPTKFYFSERATPKFHSEMGMPNVVTLDSLRLMMPESAMWPQGAMWGPPRLHGSERAKNGGQLRARASRRVYGRADNVAEWLCWPSS